MKWVDDFYKECLEKIQNEDDPAAAIDTLSAISLHDLPRVQLCKLAEQTTTLLSVIFQIAGDSPQDLTIKFQRIRQQLVATLDYMEQIIEAEKAFPYAPQVTDSFWW